MLPNYITSVRTVRKLCLGLASSIRLYNMLCFSKLTIIAQCYHMDSEVANCEKKVVQILPAGPRHSPSTEFLFSLKGLGLSIQVCSLAVHSKAIMDRAFKSTCRTLGNHLITLRFPIGDEEVFICDKVMKAWLKGSFLGQKTKHIA
jgi:hypothetical protein